MKHDDVCRIESRELPLDLLAKTRLVDRLSPRRVPLGSTWIEQGAGAIGEFYMRQRLWPDFEYHGKPQARTEIERAGLVTVGDVGFIDDDGYVFMLDRKKDMVISGGVNIYPAEIESVLITHPGVSDCAVIGIPDDEFGEIAAAIVDPANGALDEQALRGWLGDRIARNKLPRRFIFRSDLPREDSGKIFKNRLREEFWTGQKRRI